MTDSFVLTRALDASPAQVFEAWTKPDHLGWFSSELPQAAHPIEVDLRPGGAWTQLMVVGDYEQYVTGGVYLEIDEPRALSFTWGAAGGWPSLDDGLTVTVSLEALPDDPKRTELTLSLDVPSGVETHPAMQAGWSDTLDRLVAHFARE